MRILSYLRKNIPGIVLLAALAAFPEGVIYFGAHRAVIPGAINNCCVIALGYPGRPDGTPGAVQRFRMEIALDAFKAYHCRALILSGGNPHSTKAEAESMAGLAASRGVPTARMFVEKRSRTTAENIQYSLPFVQAGEHVLLASDVGHALRAKQILCRQDADQCERAHVAAPYKPLEMGVFQWVSVYWNLHSWLMDKLSG